MGDVGTRYISSSSGIVYFGLSQSLVVTFDTSGADVFRYFYNDSGGWQDSTGSQVDNYYYNDYGVGLVAAGNNQYLVHWIYMDYSGDHMYLMYGRDSYPTLVDAKDELEPSEKPWQVDKWSYLIGKVIIQRDATEITETISVFIDPIGGGVASTDHNSTTGKQGGTAGEYYHFTSVDYLTYTTNTPFTVGSLIFIDSLGRLQQDNANLFWDDTNDFLGIDTDSPSCGLQVGAGTPSYASASTDIFAAGKIESEFVYVGNNLYLEDFTPGSLLFVASSQWLEEDNSNLY